MSIIIGIVLAIAVGIVIGFLSLISLVVYIVGITSGIIITLSLIRRLGRKARRSVLASEIFYKFTKYKASVYHISKTQQPTTSVKIYGNGNDYADLVDILQHQLQLTASEARDAAKHATNIAPSQPLEEKVRVALQYLYLGDKAPQKD